MPGLGGFLKGGGTHTSALPVCHRKRQTEGYRKRRRNTLIVHSLKGEMSRNRFAFFFVSLQIKFKYPHREREEVSENVCASEMAMGF